MVNLESSYTFDILSYKFKIWKKKKTCIVKTHLGQKDLYKISSSQMKNGGLFSHPTPQLPAPLAMLEQFQTVNR